MGPVLLGQLLRWTIDEAGSRYTDPAGHIAIRYSTASSRSERESSHDGAEAIEGFGVT